MTPTDERHGTTRGYHAGCRESCCKRAMARYEKAGRLARLNGGLAVPAMGAKRRLQALMALGWSSHSIATAAGLTHRNHVWRIVHGQKGKPTVWIQRQTDAWVREVYDQLSMTVPEGGYASRTRLYAKRKGYLPPLAWDDIDRDPEPPTHETSDDVDHVLVDRILAGEFRLRSTPAEKAEAVRRWVDSGRSLRSLRNASGWKVERYLNREESAA